MANASLSGAQPPSTRLARGSIGSAHIVFFVVAAAAPLASVVGASPAAFAFGNGAGAPGAFVLAGLLYLVFSVGFTAMARHAGSAGGFYGYVSRGLGRSAGVGAAAIAILTYKSIQLAVYALFGVFVSAALAPLGVDLPWWVAVLAAMAAVWLCGARNVAFSGRLLAACMVAEIAILFLLSVGILLRGGGPEGIGLTSFAPATVFGPGLGVALVFVIGSFMGFEATAIFSEEVERPERTIPRATYAAVALIAGFYAFSTWAITLHYGASQVQATAAAGIETFFFSAAADVLGAWSVTTMEVLLIVSLFASALSFHNTITRYFHALGREGLLPRTLGAVHPRHGSPHVAGRAQALAALALLAVLVLGGVDPYAVVFAWSSAIAVIGVLTVQILVSVAVLAFFQRQPGALGIGTRIIAPMAGLIGLAATLALVIANLPMLAGADSAAVRALPLLVAVVGFAGVCFALFLRTRRPALYAALGSAITKV